MKALGVAGAGYPDRSLAGTRCDPGRLGPIPEARRYALGLASARGRRGLVALAERSHRIGALRDRRLQVYLESGAGRDGRRPTVVLVLRKTR